MGSRMVRCSCFCSLFLVVLVIGCGGGGGSSSANSVVNGVPSSGGQSDFSFAPDHVFLLVLENHGFSQVIGNSAMPYLNSLATQHTLATNYFANTHPSIDNYFMLTAGKFEANNNDAFSGIVSDDNIVRALTASGKTWKAYIESLPSTGYTGGDAYPYVRHHNPFSFLSDVQGTAQAANMVDYSQLAGDLNASSLPNFVFLLPNIEDDAHDCPGGGSNCTDSARLAAADNWLQTHVDKLIQNPALANSVFIITWDESVDTDTTNGGGQVATVLVGTHVKPGFKSGALYQHQSLLRTILTLLKSTDMPGAAGTAPSMSDCFQ